MLATLDQRLAALTEPKSADRKALTLRWLRDEKHVTEIVLQLIRQCRASPAPRTCRTIESGHTDATMS